MKNYLSFAQSTVFLEGRIRKNFEDNKNVLVINRESIINNTYLEDALKRDLEFGSVFFDVPNINSYIELVEDALKVLKEKECVGEGTYFYAASKEVHYYTNSEIAGYEKLDEIINKNFTGDFGENYLKFPEILGGIDQVARVESQHFHRLESVKSSSEIISYVLNTIKRKNLTPYERFLAAYDFTTSFTYNKFGNSARLDSDGNVIERYVSDNYISGGIEKDWRKSRTITNVLTTGHIVCVGYAELMALFCRELNIPVISETIKSIKSIKTEGEKPFEYHQRLIVRMRDGKYGIDGIYKSDPTADGHHEKDGLDIKRFIHSLVPLNKTFLNEESGFEMAAKRELSKEDMLENVNQSAEIIPAINNFGLVKKYRDLSPRHKIIKNFKNSLESNALKEAFSKGYQVNIENENIRLVFDDVELTEEDKAEYNNIINATNSSIDEIKDKKDHVFNEFLKVCDNTKEITPEQFKAGFKSVLSIVKHGYAKKESVAEGYTDWIYDANKFMANKGNKPTDTFESYKPVDFSKKENQEGVTENYENKSEALSKSEVDLDIIAELEKIEEQDEIADMGRTR